MLDASYLHANVRDGRKGQVRLQPVIRGVPSNHNRAGIMNNKKSNTHAARRGHSLVELMVVMTIMGVLGSMGIPRFQRSLEQSRADVAGANLRAIWSAQRLFWLDHRKYARDLQTLVELHLIDSSLADSNVTYTYQVADASDTGFTARATRAGSRVWSGALEIADNGVLAGEIHHSGQAIKIVPGFQ
jgi:prepilin-type N-terminal cleavage/methylation domain-containing protein